MEGLDPAPTTVWMTARSGAVWLPFSEIVR
jgi:hypothetical protein